MYNSDLPDRADLPSSAQLIRSTLIAVGTAGVLLVTVVLPSEYGVDPTGVGRVLGLTQMGEIKQQLIEEAALDAAAASVETVEPVEPDEPIAVEPEVAENPADSTPAESTETAPADVWTDTVSLTLAPGEAAEVKLVMIAGAVATYEWKTDQGFLNSDLHADGAGGQSTSYRRGRAELGDAGELEAAFDGNHGWFWRNRSEVPVTMTLRVRGAYSEVKRVL